LKSQDVRKGVACRGVHGVKRDGRVVRRAQGCWGGQLLVASAPRTGVYIICARNVRRTGRAARSRAQVDFFADVPPNAPDQ